MSIGFAVVQLDVTVVNVGVKAIGESLGSSISALQWVVSSYTLALAALILTAGALGDRIGAKRLFLIGFAIFTGASAACGLAPSLAILIAARTIPEGAIGSLLAGLTIAPVFSCQYALVGRAVTPGSETEAFTWVSAALIGGLAAGSAIGGAVIGPGGVGAPFVISCLASLLAVVIAVGTRTRVRQPA